MHADTCICIYIYMYVYIYIYICRCRKVYVTACVCMYACMYVCMHGCMYTCMHTCAYSLVLALSMCSRHSHVVIRGHARVTRVAFLPFPFRTALELSEAFRRACSFQKPQPGSASSAFTGRKRRSTLLASCLVVKHLTSHFGIFLFCEASCRATAVVPSSSTRHLTWKWQALMHHGVTDVLRCALRWTFQSHSPGA